jgi:hypothetical protein
MHYVRRSKQYFDALITLFLFKIEYLEYNGFSLIIISGLSHHFTQGFLIRRYGNILSLRVPAVFTLRCPCSLRFV